MNKARAKNLPNNKKHKGKTIWYKATVAFEMILLYLHEKEGSTTKNTILIDFQWRLTQYIDDFIPKNEKYESTD